MHYTNSINGNLSDSEAREKLKEMGLDVKLNPITINQDSLKVRNYFGDPLPAIPLIARNEQFRFIDDWVVPNIMRDRYLISNYGRVYDRAKNRFMTFQSNKPNNPDGTNDGYLKFKVAYFVDWNKLASRDIYVHRAVMICHNGVVPGYTELQVNHKNGNKMDNSMWNLEWMTASDNMYHAFNTGLAHGKRTLTNEQAQIVARRLSFGDSNADIARDTGINPNIISSIKKGESYKDITKFYPMPELRDNAKAKEDDQIHQICKLRQDGLGPSAIAKQTEAPIYVVKDVIYGRNYTDISSQYTFPEKRNTYSKMSKETVFEIANMIMSGVPDSVINEKFSLHERTLDGIKRGKYYKEYTSQIPGFVYEDNKYSFMNDADAEFVCKVLQQNPNMTNEELAATTGFAVHQVAGIKARRTFTNISSKYHW